MKIRNIQSDTQNKFWNITINMASYYFRYDSKVYYGEIFFKNDKFIDFHLS